MADSLFDGRYRYDYIYPRGRSGETLRAVDTQADDRPVVIKRPASNDAPPIRAGQEVSILNERKALTRLAGHPVLTELLGGGQFFVGGMPHQYVVMERAEGVIVADLVRELGARGERIPQLEMLVIVDKLLDLLHAAHTRDIVYNDVDAKHLFWDRDNYRLKVIDWGNAVFLEGDEVTPQGISRQTDVFQVGELLYFILTGGGRVDIPRDAGDDFRADFGQDAPQIHTRLQAIVSKALHPNPRVRYARIAELRKDLTDYRSPAERERESVLSRVSERLRRNLSKNELRGLLETLEPALAADPGYPPARQVYRETLDRLRDLEVSADLDAVRIYMESGNWTRAADLLTELREKAGPQTGRLVNLLLDCAVLLIDSQMQSPPAAALDAIVLIFEEHFERAAHVLVTQEAATEEERSLQWLFAERITSHAPEVMLLRPNLFRLELALSQLVGEGLIVTEPRVLLAEINATFNSAPASGSVSLPDVRDRYRQAVDLLTALSALLEPLSVQYNLSDRKLPLTSLQRALNATMTLADNMHVIGRQATSSPRDALAALDNSRAIDPTNPLWNAIARLLDGLYELLQSYQTYVPAADGSDLEAWLKNSRDDLMPFVERLFDEMLVGMTDGLAIAAESWAAYSAAIINGNRIGAITALSKAIDAVSTISPTLAGWLNQLRSVITGASHIERHAVYGGLGRALADGWEAFDRGRLSDAERLGQQAFEIARSDPERFAARRLRGLAQASRDWVERNGSGSARRTAAVLETIEEVFTPEERAVRENFAAQMPTNDTYLRAMGRGLIELYARSSSAATRLLYFHFVLMGTLDAHEARLEDAEFWREASVRALGDYGPRHPATRALDEFIERRRDINAAAAVLNQVSGSHALATLETTRRQIEENAQARALAAAVHSLRELEACLRDWSDGEFRPAGIKLENAINAVNEVEQAADITLTAYRAWLMDLQAHAAELHTISRQMRQAIERRPQEPDAAIHEAHRRQVEVTTRVLGESYAATLRQWRDTYEAFLTVYTDTDLRRSAKLARFNELFRAMFIDRHPAYPLYRHWYELTENAPEFPAPPTDEPVPRLEAEEIAEIDYRGSRYADTAQTRAPRRLSPMAIVAGLGIVIAVIALLALSGALTPRDEGLVPGVKLTLSDTPSQGATQSGEAALASDLTSSALPGETGEPTDTLDPARVTPTLPLGAGFATPTLLPPIETSTPPTSTATATTSATPSATPSDTSTSTATSTPSATPTATFTPSNTPTPTLPPEGLQGPQDLLELSSRLSAFPWDSDQFALTTSIEGTYWRLGVGTETGGETINIALPTDLLEHYYGNHAAARIRRAEATLTLTSFIPSLMAEKQVYFGMLFEGTEDSRAERVGLHIEVPQPNVLNLGQRRGDDVEIISQRAVNTVVVRVRLERDLASGQIALFVNDVQVGDPLPFVGPDAPIVPVLFVRDGGVIVSVTSWKITLR